VSMGEVGLVRTIARGATRRCPRCGGGHLFAGWFTIKDRCPTCGLRFVREEGDFLGAYVINYGVVSAVVAVVLFLVIALEANGEQRWLVPLIATGGVVAVAAPIIGYPFSKTIWAAIELLMRPLEPREVADADQAEAAAREKT
jgi:uncharacterized protein (DUF983 family)